MTLQVSLPFMATPAPPWPVSTHGAGRGRSQTSSQQSPSSPPINPSDSEFQADKTEAGSVPPDVPSCFPGTGQAWLFWGSPHPRPNHTLPSMPAFPGERERQRMQENLGGESQSQSSPQGGENSGRRPWTCKHWRRKMKPSVYTVALTL